MYTQCSRTCNTCEYYDVKKRCTRSFLNISDVPAFGPGEMGQMFRNLKLKFGHRYNITYLSTSPWVVTIDDFISDAEIDAMLNGVAKWYDINGVEYAEYFGGNVIPNDARGVVIGWCFGECDKASRGVLERMNLLTSVPINNIESFQVSCVCYVIYLYIIPYKLYMITKMMTCNCIFLLRCSNTRKAFTTTASTTTTSPATSALCLAIAS